MPEVPNVVPGEPVESAWGNDIRDRAVMKYADATARDFSVPFPAFGELCWLDDPGHLTVYTIDDVWVPIEDSFTNDGRYVFTAGDTMTGNLTVPKVIGTLVGPQEVKAGFTNLATTLGSTWTTLTEIDAWLPGITTYHCTMAGTYLMNGPDALSYAASRLVRGSDDFQIIISHARSGVDLSATAGVFDAAAVLQATFSMAPGESVKFQAQRQGNGSSGTVSIQQVGVEVRPIVTLANLTFDAFS